MLSLHDIFDKIKTKFQELECKWTGQMEEFTPKNISHQKRSFSSSIKSLSVHAYCRIKGLIFKNFHVGACPQTPLAVQITLRSSTGECDFFLKGWTINFLSGLLLFFPGSPVGY